MGLWFCLFRCLFSVFLHCSRHVWINLSLSWTRSCLICLFLLSSCCWFWFSLVVVVSESPKTGTSSCPNERGELADCPPCTRLKNICVRAMILHGEAARGSPSKPYFHSVLVWLLKVISGLSAMWRVSRISIVFGHVGKFQRDNLKTYTCPI